MRNLYHIIGSNSLSPDLFLRLARIVFKFIRNLSSPDKYFDTEFNFAINFKGHSIFYISNICIMNHEGYPWTFRKNC